VLRELGRSTDVRRRMVQLGLLPSAKEETRRVRQPNHVPGARNILMRFGIKLPNQKLHAKEDRRLDPFVTVGRPHWNETTLRLTRQALYERVWAEPVDVLAKSWGLSGRGLANVCKRAGVPVPPRGYWARVQHGQHPRRVPLREMLHPVEILIHLPPKADRG